MLLDLDSLEWDDELLHLFGIDPAVLPRVATSAEVVGESDLLGVTVPIAGIAGDQQAALVGHGCFRRGEAKATYGTGSFVLVHAGEERERAPEGLLETRSCPGRLRTRGRDSCERGRRPVAPRRPRHPRDAAESEALALQVDSTDGVYFVPALAGLGSPHWRPDVRGLVTGIDPRDDARSPRARRARGDRLPGGRRARRVSGRRRGVAGRRRRRANHFLMQFQADLLGCPIEVAAERETTALGAAALAGRAIGLWTDDDAIRARINRGAVYEPTGDPAKLGRLRSEWRLAVRRALLA